MKIRGDVLFPLKVNYQINTDKVHKTLVQRVVCLPIDPLKDGVSKKTTLCKLLKPAATGFAK